MERLLTLFCCLSGSLVSGSGKLCLDATFWSREAQACVPCSACSWGTEQVFPCQPFQDTVCEAPRRVPPPPPSLDEVHQTRVAEERARLDQVEVARVEGLASPWQLTVFAVTVLVTFPLVFLLLLLLLRRTRQAVKKGLDDYSHLLVLNRTDQRRDANDQGALAYADFDRIKIGRRPFDSPYSDLSTPTRPGATRAAPAAKATYDPLSQQV